MTRPILDFATRLKELVKDDLAVLPMPKETHPDHFRATTERKTAEFVEISYTPMGPEGNVAVSRLKPQSISQFQTGEMVFVPGSESDRRGRALWRLCQVL